ncbi:NAD-dependent epimerase/dehydratase family protein [Streptomyces hyaluromycini]|uniref:NAD-dependent epimerase/dehydratase family protein n=1 Tax=Streptomyces hyaluromycini TaxID=1377993 RepID=UPI000B5C273A|nr:NAD(P)-dependent oxidoreductase [Streptomyces hyaluromycini]
MTGRRIVVLGATGFLGRHIAQACAAEGHWVLGVSRATPHVAAGHRAALDLAATTTARLGEFLLAHRPDVVVNAVGTVWQADEQRMRELNDVFVHRLVTALAELPSPARLVHLGSVHEYGPTPAGVPLTETQDPSPAGTYGWTKLRGTRRVQAAAGDGLDAVTLRVANACGPGAPPQSLLGKVAAELAGQAGLTGGTGELRLAPLRARRDFVDVRDVAEAALAAAFAAPDVVAGRTINIGRGQAVPVRDLVDRLVALSGLPVRLVEAESPDGTRSGAEWQQTDITLARLLLGWRPRRTLDASLRDLLAGAWLRQPASPR